MPMQVIAHCDAHSPGHCDLQVPWADVPWSAWGAVLWAGEVSPPLPPPLPHTYHDVDHLERFHALHGTCLLPAIASFSLPGIVLLWNPRNLMNTEVS